MRMQKVLLTILGVFGFGAGMTANYPTQAAAPAQAEWCIGLTEEECCKVALEKNTIEALQEFLRLYPPGRSDSACSALALTALSEFDSGGDRNEGYNQ